MKSVVLYKFIGLCFLVLLENLILGQHLNNFQFKQITTENGLADNIINTIHQDKTGFIWIGTSYGLSRYDAYSITNYRNIDGDTLTIVNNNILCIADDSIPGNLWIGTHAGLCYYNRYTESFRRHNFQKNDVSPDYSVEDLLFSSNHGLIVATNKGIFIESHDKTIWLRSEQENINSLCHDEVLCVFEDSYHQIWVGTRNGVDIYDPVNKTFQHLNLSIDTNNPLYVYNILEDYQHNIMICSRYHGLIVLYGGNLNNSQVFNSSDTNLGGNWIQDALPMDDTKYWLSVRDVGLVLLDRNTGKTLHFKPDIFDPYNKNNINSKATTCLFKDIQNNIWVGTYPGGVNMLDMNIKPFQHNKVTSKPDGLHNNHIRALFQDSENRIWIGTKEEGGLSEYKPERDVFQHYLKNQDLPGSINDDYVFCIEELNKDTLLIGTFRGGINIFDKGSAKFSAIMHGPDIPRRDLLNAVYTILKDSKERIWVGTLKNLCILDIKKKNFTLIDSIFEVLDIIEDNNQNVWFASSRTGLYKLNEQSGKILNVNLKDSDNQNIKLSRINHITVDSKNKLWIATNESGIIAFDTESDQCKLFTSENGLPSDQIMSIVEDNQGNIWVSTSGGLSMLDIRNHKFINYDTYDGLQANNFDRQVCLKINTGELIFGGNHGFTLFQPLDIKKNNFIPPVYITGFKISNKAVNFREIGSVLAKPIMVTKEITLKHNQADLTFEFAALNYSVPEKNKYAFMLEGYDKAWRYAGTDRRAVYTNIDPGKYSFRVKASNNDDVWNENDTSVMIRILPPFWNTWVAYIIYILAIAIILNAIFQYIKLKEKFRNDLLRERLQRKKEEELHLFKMKFFTNISHEFRTPLSLITGPLQEIIKSADKFPFREQIHMVYRNASHLLQQINQLMDFRQIETQNREPVCSKIEIVSFIRERIESFSLLTKQKEIELIFKTDLNALEAEIDPEMFGSVLNNLLSNAIKFSDIKSRIHIILNKEIFSDYQQTPNRYIILNKIPGENESFFEVIIKDYGHGIDHSDLYKIFDRYYRTEMNVKKFVPGTGIGLAIVKAYVEAHGGNIIVESIRKKGTVFFIQLPIKYHNKKEISSVSFNDRVEFSFPMNDDSAEILEEENRGEIETATFPKILIIEDNLDMQQFLEDNLSAMYNINKAFNAEDGLEKSFSIIPDIIISDVMMPGMDGIKLCQVLKTDHRTSHIPVILLTAKNNMESRINGIKTGADAYISKPFDLRYLKAQIENLLAQRKQLRTLFSKKITLNPGEITTTSIDEKFLQKTLQIIDDYITDSNFSIEFLCKELGMSRSNLHLKIKALTDMSTSEFIKTIRLKRAAQLLSSGGYNVNEVVYMVGFTSPSYFTQCFKNLFKVLPHHYMKEAIKSKDSKVDL